MTNHLSSSSAMMHLCVLRTYERVQPFHHINIHDTHITILSSVKERLFARHQLIYPPNLSCHCMVLIIEHNYDYPDIRAFKSHNGHFVDAAWVNNIATIAKDLWVKPRGE